MGSENTVIVKLTCAVVIDGKIQRAGTKLELVDDEAKTLLRLGKAELVSAPAAPATTDNQAAAAQAAAAAVKAAPAPAPTPAPAAAAPVAPVVAAPAVAAAPAGR